MFCGIFTNLESGSFVAIISNLKSNWLGEKCILKTRLQGVPGSNPGGI